LALFMLILTGCFEKDTRIDAQGNSEYLEVTNFTPEDNTDELGNVILGESNDPGSSTIIHSSTLIPIDKLVTISFSESINAQTVNTSTAYINNPSGEPIPAQLTVVNNQISIIPNEFLLPDERYTIVITTGVKDIRGRSLEGVFFYTFPTELDITIDLIAPTLLNLSPANATIAPVTTAIVMSFDERIAGTGVLNLRDITSSSDGVGVSSINGNSLEFTANTALVAGHSY